jgi:regulator of replication initiation timing
MAKVLYAAGAQMDPRLMAELASLRARVAELERQNTELRLENAAFDDEVRSLAAEPPVLA